MKTKVTYTSGKEIEEFRDIPGYLGLYKVSKTGRVISIERYIKRLNHTVYISEKELSKFKDKHGYWYVKLNKNNKSFLMLLHRAIALAFIPNPHNYSCVNHIDMDKGNYSIENLEWCTHKYNLTEAYNRLNFGILKRKPFTATFPDGRNESFTSIKEAPSKILAMTGIKLLKTSIAKAMREGKKYKGFILIPK